jgi:hypothetical protein
MKGVVVMNEQIFTKRCYFCGVYLPNSGEKLQKEHVPPDMLTPPKTAALTVFSCPDHNTAKSSLDREFLIFLGKSALVTPATGEIPKEVFEFYERYKKAFEEEESGKIPVVPLVEPVPLVLEGIESFPQFTKPVRMLIWYRMLTAGVIYSATKMFDKDINWPEISIIPMYSPMSAEINITKEELVKDFWLYDQIEALVKNTPWHNGWKPDGKPVCSPNLYHFRVSLLPGPKIIVEHCFFRDFRTYAIVSCSRETYSKVARKLFPAKRTNKPTA